MQKKRLVSFMSLHLSVSDSSDDIVAAIYYYTSDPPVPGQTPILNKLPTIEFHLLGSS